ncbi:MAG: hypothetical protein ACLFT4_10685 [Bacteroidales bacterium]
MKEYTIPLEITVDLNRLEEESVNLISESYQVGLQMAELNAEVDEAKVAMERVEAHIELNYREEWENIFPDIKFSEAAVKKQVSINPQYVEAQDNYYNIKRKRAKFGVYDSNLTRKEKAIDNLVKLWASNYFQKHNTPKAVKEIQESENKSQARKNLSSNSRLKNRKKKEKSVKFLPY